MTIRLILLFLSAASLVFESSCTPPMSTATPRPEASATVQPTHSDTSRAPQAQAADIVQPLPSASASVIEVNPDNLQNPGKAVLELAKNRFQPGEAFEVRFEARPNQDFDNSAWAGIVSSDLPHGKATDNDLFDLAYAPLGGHRSGVLEFKAPETPGIYDVRLHSSEKGREVIYVSFEVIGNSAPLTGNALRLAGSRFRPDGLIEVAVSIRAEDKKDNSAWVGIVPAAAPHGDEAANDKINLGYQYLGEYLSGKMLFRAPKTPGLYDLRLHDTDLNGKELAFVSFIVIAD